MIMPTSGRRSIASCSRPDPGPRGHGLGSLPSHPSPRSQGASRTQLAYLSDCSDWRGKGTDSTKHPKRLHMGRWQNAAQPLQYSMGKGWDGGSTPQELADRAHSRDTQVRAREEEMAQ
jgi:hypothetical protein